MHRPSLATLLLLFPCLPVLSAAVRADQPAGAGVYATIDTTLPTAGKQIRMFAFDGDPKTYFASEKNPDAKDHFTLVLDKPVAVTWIVATTGKPEGGDALDAGTLQVSKDGKKFEPAAKFADGVALASLKGQEVIAVRIQPTAALNHPLAIRDIAILSNPAVAIYKYPVEFTLDASDATDLKEWGEKVIRECERSYQWMGDELASPGYRPPTTVRMVLSTKYRGVAAAGGGRITGSAAYFKGHLKDVGAMVHETVHIQQRYGYRGNPGWLVEGIADYIRFFKYEPGKIGDFNPARAKYNGSYRVTARFLDYVTQKYDKEIVAKLNRAMREGKYKEEIWKNLTGKTLQELGEEWKTSITRKETKDTKEKKAA
jgi:Peptidase of plants and bacteria